MEQEIFGISKFREKKDNLDGWTEIFETNFRKLTVPFDFEPELAEISVEWNAPISSFGYHLVSNNQFGDPCWRHRLHCGFC